MKLTPQKYVTPYFGRDGNPGIGAALQTIVAPAANTKGVVVFAAWCWMSVGTSRAMAKASAPSTMFDSGANTLAFSQTGNYGAAAFPIVLSPGIGLYAQRSELDTTAGGIAVEYEVL